MRFLVTSAACEETALVLRELASQVESLLRPFVGDQDFGGSIDQITFVLVSVDDNPVQNAAWAKANDKLGSYSHVASGDRVRYLSLAVQLPPQQLLATPSRKRPVLIREALAARLAARPHRLPRGFRYQDFAAAVLPALAQPGAVA